MTAKLQVLEDSNVVELTVTGKLRRADYDELIPLLEAQIERHGKIRVLFQMIDFHGWDLAGFWADLKFDIKHFAENNCRRCFNLV